MPKKPHFSVTQILDFNRCPLKFYLKYRQELKELVLGGEKDALFGSLVHFLLAKWDFSSDTISSLWKNSRFPHDVSLFEEDVVLLLERLAMHPFVKKLRCSAKVSREELFVYEGRDFTLEGVIDLLFEDNGALNIVDFKTNSVSPERVAYVADAFQFQLDCYAFAVGEIVSCQPAATHVFFVRTGDVITVPMDGNRLRETQQKVKGIVSRILEGEFSHQFSTHCQYCGFYDYCY